MAELARAQFQDRFEQGLRQAGASIALNGAAYRIIRYVDEASGSQTPACERMVIGHRREVITGYGGREFVSEEEVIAWAIADGERILVDGLGYEARPKV